MSFVLPRSDPSARRDRLKGVALAALVHVLLGYALIIGLRVKLPPSIDRALTLIDLRTPPPPAPAPPPPQRQARPRSAGAASAPNLVSEPTELVAPVPVILVPTVPVSVVAPVAGVGAAPSAGAAPIPGPGNGAGGSGDGRGGGGTGDGDGGTPLRLVSGELTDDDYPRAALAAGAAGTVGLRFVVGVKGRVTACTVTKSSGNADLDDTTCRLIMRRLRYRPSLDAQGRPVADVVTGEQRWTLDRRGGEEEDGDER